MFFLEKSVYINKYCQKLYFPWKYMTFWRLTTKKGIKKKKNPKENNFFFSNTKMLWLHGLSLIDKEHKTFCFLKIGW